MTPGTALEVRERPQLAAAPAPVVAVTVTVEAPAAYGWRAWWRTNPGPRWIVYMAGAELVAAGSGIWWGFFIHPAWAFGFATIAAWKDWRQDHDARRYLTRWHRT